MDAHFALAAIGDGDMAQQALRRLDIAQTPPAFKASVEAVVASYTAPADDAIQAIERAMAVHVDPEALFLFGGMLVRVGAADRGLEVLADAVAHGYTPALTLAQNPGFNPVREHRLFKTTQEQARQAMRAAQEMFEAAGGPEMLGMPPATRLSR